MSKTPRLSKLLKSEKTSRLPPSKSKARLKELQLNLLRIQEGLFHHKRRAIIALEGFDAAGKGGAIRKLTEVLDPRGAIVHPIGPPSPEEQGRHWLYRFWMGLPLPGTLVVFDRTWYGRVLVERVEGLTPKERWKQAYQEINHFESLLLADGIDLVKIFLGISKKEQLERFRERLTDPYKQWKLTPSDIEARKKWGDYVEAVDEMMVRTHTDRAPWHLIPADNKEYARLKVLEIVTDRLGHHRAWMEKKALEDQNRSVKDAIKALGIRP